MMEIVRVVRAVGIVGESEDIMVDKLGWNDCYAKEVRENPYNLVSGCSEDGSWYVCHPNYLKATPDGKLFAGGFVASCGKCWEGDLFDNEKMAKLFALSPRLADAFLQLFALRERLSDVFDSNHGLLQAYLNLEADVRSLGF